MNKRTINTLTIVVIMMIPAAWFVYVDLISGASVAKSDYPPLAIAVFISYAVAYLLIGLSSVASGHGYNAWHKLPTGSRPLTILKPVYFVVALFKLIGKGADSIIDNANK